MQEKRAKYHLNKDSEFVIENYNFAKPFANFFPGIAGKYGIPMWVFYVNRGQGIISFGTKDKDHSILEFQPANKAWYLVYNLGFRTFIKLQRKKGFVFYEPFHNGIVNSGFDLNNRMRITSYGLDIEEKNSDLGLETLIEYFTIPQDNYAALARMVTIRNISKSAKSLQVMDGLPQVVPYGVTNLFLKKLSRTIEAWMHVENLENGVPFYKLDVDPTDRPQVLHIKKGNFYLSFHRQQEKSEILTPIVDPQAVFGTIGDFSCPRRFLKDKNFAYPKDQVTKNKTPSALAFLNIDLPAGGEKTLYSLVGNMRSQEMLNLSLSKLTNLDYLQGRKAMNRQIVEQLQNDVLTRSSSEEFDLYAKQTYLDNIMRGGYPVIFGANTDGKPKANTAVFYLYSRKHGDLERDYNKFMTQATYFSQGNGNYRDINQNRRSDVWFNPDVKEENVVSFFNLIQADGFNPLVVKGENFVVNPGRELDVLLKDAFEDADIEKMKEFLKGHFSPGELVFFIEDNRIKPKVFYDELLDMLLPLADRYQDAEHGEGFWTDHWTYNLDLLENYLGVYPEKLKELVFDKRSFTFYDNAAVVKPRGNKYILLDGQVKQLHSVSHDTGKKEMIAKRDFSPHLVRTDYGSGRVYETTLINKLLCVLANKLASLDPFGVGIELEADKPNWFDALNGLPALFGSSLCETFELKRWAVFIKQALGECGAEKITVTEEVRAFLDGLDKLIKENLSNNSPEGDFVYWDKSCALKEEYREKIKFGFSGKEVDAQLADLVSLLDDAVIKLESAINKAYGNKAIALPPSYFINEVKEYVHSHGQFVKPIKFSQTALPLFLEAPVHAMRLSENKRQAQAIYDAVKKSPLYDSGLKMYKVTDSLKSMPEEIGRCRVFTPGWLESESIWLHMEYKYLLEIIKAGLYEEFYAEFKNLLIPFQKPQKYGRSILENSSFLVSSAFPDKELHGNGFVARLSGSTAEFLNIWLVMNLGNSPFSLDEKQQLSLKFSPVLAGWLFDKKTKAYSFNFLSKISVAYHNPKLKDTFGKKGVSPQRIVFRDKLGEQIEVKSDCLSSPYAEQVRQRLITKIDIYLG